MCRVESIIKIKKKFYFGIVLHYVIYIVYNTFFQERKKMSTATMSMPKSAVKSKGNIARAIGSSARRSAQTVVSATASDTLVSGATKEERYKMWDKFLEIETVTGSGCHPSIVGFTEDTFMEFVNDVIHEDREVMSRAEWEARKKI